MYLDADSFCDRIYSQFERNFEQKPASNLMQKINQQLRIIKETVNEKKLPPEKIKLLKEISELKSEEMLERLDFIQKILNDVLISEHHEIPANSCDIVFLSTIDNEDHNAALTPSFEKTHFTICSRALITGHGQNSEEVPTAVSVRNAKIMREQEADFDFFCAADSNAQELIVCVPKALDPQLTPYKKLAKYGFDYKNFRNVSVEEILQGPTQKENLDNFYKLFDTASKTPRNIYIQGHGGSGGTAGVSKERLPKLFEFFNQANFKSVCLSSCAAGGTITASYFSDSTQEKLYQHEYKFLLTVRNLTDFLSGPVNLNLKEYFNSVRQLSLDNLRLRQVSEIFKSVNYQTQNVFEDEAPLFSKSQARYKALLPLNFDKGKGFRGLELENFFKVSAGVIARHNAVHPGQPMQTGWKDAILLHPIFCPIAMRVHNAPLLSMIPGNSHHYLESLKLDEVSIEKWLETTNQEIYQHSKYRVLGKKGFFMAELRDSHGTSYSNFFLLAVPKLTLWGGVNTFTGEVVLKREESWGAATIPCSLAQLVVSQFVAFQETNPDSKFDFNHDNGFALEKIFSRECWPSTVKFSAFMTAYLQATDKNVLMLEDFGTLNPEEKNALLSLALYQGHHDLAFDLVQDNDINPNFTILEKMPLLNLAIKNNFVDIVDVLIKRGANVNKYNPWIDVQAPLIAAFQARSPAIVKRLLQEETIDLAARDGDLLNLWRYAAANDELTEILAATGKAPDPNMQGDKGFTALHLYVKNNDEEGVLRLLKQGANVNMGAPSALITAIQKQNEPMIKLLLSHGAAINQPDVGVANAISGTGDFNKGGNLPLVEAVRKLQPETLARLLKENHFDLLKRDVRGKNALLAAFERGNDAVIHLILEELKKQGLIDSVQPYQTELLKIANARGDKKQIHLINSFSDTSSAA